MFTATRLNKKVLTLGSFGGLALALLVFAFAGAASKEDIVYPVAELGNCADEPSCRAYCENPSSLDECVAFAEKYNLISSEEAEKARKFKDIAQKGGPGGCRSEEECRNYCEDISRIDECLAFAEEHGFIDQKEITEAKKVSEVLKGGGNTPGSCRTKNACEAYCEDPDNIDECLAFAEKTGILPPDELEEIRGFQKAVKAGAQPPKCKGRAQCDFYCTQPENMRECLAFAEKAGFMKGEELEQVKKFLPLLESGETPGGCRGKNECETYCKDESHMEACFAFAEKAGIIKPEEAEMIRKHGFTGPGGCKGREQ